MGRPRDVQRSSGTIDVDERIRRIVPLGRRGKFLGVVSPSAAHRTAGTTVEHLGHHLRE